MSELVDAMYCPSCDEQVPVTELEEDTTRIVRKCMDCRSTKLYPSREAAEERGARST
jgi:Zn ribbon nucleic-acid-binding protein